VASAVGTDFAPQPSGTILFLEDSGEPPYRVDRMLTQLRNAGLFDLARGVVFGAMLKCTDPYNDLKSVIREVLDGFSVPDRLRLAKWAWQREPVDPIGSANRDG
jgi:muramoyltetrapeptide carboxypeptidase